MTDVRKTPKKDQTARLRDWMMTDVTLVVPRWALAAVTLVAVALVLLALD